MTDTKTPEAQASKPRRRWLVPVSILVLFVLGAAGGMLWFFSGDAPDEVDLAATASSVAGDDAVTDSETAATDVAASDSAVDGIDGEWTVDTSIGDFTVEDTTTATFVGFRVDEVLNSIGSTTAVGRTPDVSGSITIEGTTLTSAEIVADLTTIISDESRREDNIQDALNTSTNPEATFVLTETIELGEAAANGEQVDVTAVGELTVNGITNEVEVDLSAQLVDGTVLVTGTTEIVFADYDVSPPSAPVVVSVEDNGIVEIQLWLSR